MLPLPERPDLDQLRRQARELLRAARAGDPSAVARLGMGAVAPTLGAAQLALARDHGFSSWTALKEEVARRRAGDSIVIRPVATRAELAEVFDVAGAQITPPLSHSDGRGHFAALDNRFDEDRPLMLAAVAGGRIAGGALAFRGRSGAATLRIIGLAPPVRGWGVGRWLVETLAAEASRLGCQSIAVGGVTPDVRGFYQRLRFRGRRSMMRLEL